MGILLTLSYNVFCMILFKVFKIPMNKVTVPTAVVGGIFLIGTLLSLMNYNHPYSAVSRQYFQSTPIIPAVKGRVISVDVKPNTPLKAGDILFKIDPVPFQYKVDSLKGQLKSLKIDLHRARVLRRKNVGSQRDVDIMQAKVEGVQGKLGDAQYDLEQTVVRAASDGRVLQLFIHPGLYVVASPLRPAMVFVNADSYHYIAWFRQNNLQRLEAGNEAQIAFDAVPGVIFSAEVIHYLPALAEGELQATGSLYAMNLSKNAQAGRVPVMIKITDSRFADYAETLPGGAYAQTAVYSKHVEWTALIRRMLLSMSSWMNYLFPFR